MSREDEVGARPRPPVAPYRPVDPRAVALRERSRLIVASVVLVIAKLVLVFVNVALAMSGARDAVRLAGVAAQAALTVVLLILLMRIVRLSRH